VAVRFGVPFVSIVFLNQTPVRIIEPRKTLVEALVGLLGRRPLRIRFFRSVPELLGERRGTRLANVLEEHVPCDAMDETDRVPFIVLGDVR
jgi:hypothetical protein